MKRLSKSARTGDFIPTEIIQQWIEEHKNKELAEFHQVQDNLSINGNSPQGLFAVDNKQNPTKFFVADFEPFEKNEHRGEFSCLVSSIQIEYDKKTKKWNTVGNIDCHMEYGNMRQITRSSNVLCGSEPMIFVNSKNVIELLDPTTY